MSVPSPESQIRFLQQVQRLFTEGEFSATYKYALILALAELAVERGDNSGQELDLPLLAIGEKFAELYWRQLSPYSSGQPLTQAGILHQNRGAQVAILKPLLGLHQATGGKLATARSLRGWKGAISAVAGVVRQMPLKHLQVLGGRLEPFLYDYPIPARASVIRLKPGVAYNLRCYQGLIQQLARTGWVEHIRQAKQNAPMLGQLDDLETFMFGSARAPLSVVADVLAPLQGHRCFYCRGKLDGRGEVDHFIPWVRYPRDTAHNFVLAHRSCNNDKRDMLAARPHLEAWMEQLHALGAELGEALAPCGFVADAKCSKQIATWAYQQSIGTGSMGWLAKDRYEPLDLSYLTLLEGMV